MPVEDAVGVLVKLRLRGDVVGEVLGIFRNHASFSSAGWHLPLPSLDAAQYRTENDYQNVLKRGLLVPPGIGKRGKAWSRAGRRTA